MNDRTRAVEVRATDADVAGLPATVRAAAERCDGPARAAIAAAHAALAAAEGRRPARDRILLVVAAEEGSAAADRTFWATAAGEGGRLASPAAFAATLPSFLAGDLATALGLTGPALVLAVRRDRSRSGPAVRAVAHALRVAGAIDAVLEVRPPTAGEARAGAVLLLLPAPGGDR